VREVFLIMRMGSSEDRLDNHFDMFNLRSKFRYPVFLLLVLYIANPYVVHKEQRNLRSVFLSPPEGGMDLGTSRQDTI